MSTLIDIDVFLNAIAEKVAEKLATRATSGAAAAEAYYDARTAPCGKRPFLEAAARGDFPSFKTGRKVLARRADVERWIEAQPRTAPRAAAPASDLDARLDSALARAAARRASPRRRAAGE